MHQHQVTHIFSKWTRVNRSCFTLLQALPASLQFIAGKCSIFLLTVSQSKPSAATSNGPPALDKSHMMFLASMPSISVMDSSLKAKKTERFLFTTLKLKNRRRSQWIKAASITQMPIGMMWMAMATST